MLRKPHQHIRTDEILFKSNTIHLSHHNDGSNDSRGYYKEIFLQQVILDEQNAQQKGGKVGPKKPPKPAFTIFEENIEPE